MKNTEVLIVGAGMAGVSLAWRLAQTGVRPLIVERESQPGTQSTGRSAAMFMESYGPVGIRALTRAGRQFYTHPPEGFTAVPILHSRPTLYVGTEAQWPSLKKLEVDLASTGAPLLWVDAARIMELAPVLRPGLYTRGLYDADSDDIDVDALLQGFLRGAKKVGAELMTEAEPVRAQADAGGWTVELSNGETVRAGVVVNAAGAWADVLAPLFGVRSIGLQPKRRSAMTFAVPPEKGPVASLPMTVDADEAWYFKPEAGLLLGSPANANPVEPHDVQPEEMDIAIAIDRIQSATTLTIRRPAATWAGLRSFVPDGDIVIGYDDRQPRFFWLAAQGGYGIQSAAGASLLAATLLLRHDLPEALTRFGVDPAIVSPQRLARG